MPSKRVEIDRETYGCQTLHLLGKMHLEQDSVGSESLQAVHAGKNAQEVKRRGQRT